MRYLKEWPRLLLTLPCGIRFSILTLCFLLCMVVHILTFPASHNGSLLTIPVGLAAWMFKKRGLFTCLACGISILVVYHTIRLGSLWWPYSFTLFFLGGIFVLLIEGSIVVTLRNLVDSADAARLKAEQAERQTAIAYGQQRQLNELKNQFIMSVNHELRTPLTSLYSYLELSQLIMEREGQLDRTKHGAFLKNALRSCNELRSSVNSVLDTMKLGSDTGQLILEELSVTEVVSDVVEHIDTVEQRAHSIHLDIPRHLTVHANAQCIRHVLRNLISNAFRYTPPDTSVVVSATLSTDTVQQTETVSQVCISVKDSGPGIPQDEIPLLFGQFVRLKRDLRGRVRGTGLGLYISKHLVEAMGGRIWVESTGIPGEGSRFCFTLPCTPHGIN